LLVGVAADETTACERGHVACYDAPTASVMTTHRLALISVLLLGGCAASRQYFQPTERVRGVTIQGYRESIYPLMGPHGHFGEAKLWSRGAYRGPGGLTVVHVSIEIHNTSGAHIELAATDVRLDPVRTDDGVLTDVAPAETSRFAVAPGTIVEERFHFVLPAGTTPGEVSAFRVRWRVTNAGQTYSQHTPFVEHYWRYGYGPRYGYGYHYFCDPFDPFCFGPGYGYYGPTYGVYRPIYVSPPPRSSVHFRR
jgi:hypothetical protein